ncbi:MAG: hypothetical protein ABIQ31_17915 [Ferruginibacter sp.]
MRIYQLFHALIEKFVPMDKSTQDDLQLEAVKFYNQALEEKIFIDISNEEIVKDNSTNFNVDGYDKKAVKPYKLKHKVIGFLDQWYIRYLNALLFIYLVPKIKNFINGDSEAEEGDDEEEDQGDFKQFMEYQRYKKSMI